MGQCNFYFPVMNGCCLSCQSEPKLGARRPSQDPQSLKERAARSDRVALALSGKATVSGPTGPNCLSADKISQERQTSQVPSRAIIQRSKIRHEIWRLADILRGDEAEL